MTGLDDAMREATAALTARLRALDDTEAGNQPDPEVFAREYVTALVGHGWRPTAAGRPPSWRQTEPPANPEHAARAAAAARAEIRRTRHTHPDPETAHQEP